MGVKCAVPVVAACLVNHNTSVYAELALRSLLATHGPDGPAAISVTVVDNHSSDAGFQDLQSAILELGATLQFSDWPVGRSWVNSHGDVMRAFVRSQSEAEYLLFIDSDIVFERPGVVWTMFGEASADSSVWAVQARFQWFEQHVGRGSSLDLWAGQEQRWWVGLKDPTGAHDYPIRGLSKRRCHPACTLIVNSAEFRRVSEIVGLSGAIVISQDAEMAGFHDTLGLASQVMHVLGLRYILSEAEVVHYGNVTYEGDSEIAATKAADCRQRLEVLRGIAHTARACDTIAIQDAPGTPPPSAQIQP